MRKKNLILKTLIAIITVLSSCSVNEVAVDRNPHNWVVMEICNNTDENIIIDLCGIKYYFDVTHDARVLNNVYALCYHFQTPKLTAKNEQKFIKEFADLAADNRLYENFPVYTVNAPMWYAECLYGKDINRKNPLELYEYKDSYNVTLLPKSAKKVYYWFIGADVLGGGESELKSVKMDITLSSKKLTLLGWEEEVWHYDASDDINVKYCLDVWYDAGNPAKDDKNWNSTLSPSLSCYCFEETVTINGDTTSDIVVTKNRISFPNDEL